MSKQTLTSIKASITLEQSTVDTLERRAKYLNITLDQLLSTCLNTGIDLEVDATNELCSLDDDEDEDDYWDEDDSVLDDEDDDDDDDEYDDEE